MEAILKQDNVYEVIEIDDETFEKNYEEYKNNENFIWGINYQNVSRFIKKGLYGDRVFVDDEYIEIDGKRLINIDDNISYYDSRRRYDVSDSFKRTFDIKEIVAFLNQIENLGLDAFIDNYKFQLQNFKKELETIAEVMQNDLAIHYEEDKANEINILRNKILYLTFLICGLLINMNAGLSNQHYIDAYDMATSIFV